VLSNVSRLFYFFADVATGDFFDDDVQIANPKPRVRPSRMTSDNVAGRAQFFEVADRPLTDVRNGLSTV
jgi:hypothetical protein